MLGLDLVGVLIVFVLAPAELEAGGLYFVCVMGMDVCGGVGEEEEGAEVTKESSTNA